MPSRLTHIKRFLSNHLNYNLNALIQLAIINIYRTNVFEKLSFAAASTLV